jgi:hypothetical protein
MMACLGFLNLVLKVTIRDLISDLLSLGSLSFLFYPSFTAFRTVTERSVQYLFQVRLRYNKICFGYWKQSKEAVSFLVVR